MSQTILASDAGRYVESVGKPSCGFDLIMLVADGHPKVMERCTEESGQIDVRLHLAEPAPSVV